MPYNPKSLDNLKPFKKGDKRTKKAAQKAAEKTKEVKKRKATMNEVAKAVLDCELTGEMLEIMKKKYPDLPEEFFTERLSIFTELRKIFYKAERDSDKIAALNALMAYAGETPETVLMKQQIEMKMQFETDPFSKSIKELKQ